MVASADINEAASGPIRTAWPSFPTGNPKKAVHLRTLAADIAHQCPPARSQRPLSWSLAPSHGV